MSETIKHEPEEDIDKNSKDSLGNELASIKMEKKVDIPETNKSSMEILSELFSTFNAKPPLIIKKEKDEELSSKKHKKKKKHKHKHKKHKHKSKKKSSDSSSEDEIDLTKLLIKEEKVSSIKKIKIEGTELSLDLDLKQSQSETINDPKTPTGSPRKDKHKIVIKDLSKCSVFESDADVKKEHEDTTSGSKIKKHKKKHKHKSKKRSRSKSKDREEPKKRKIEDLREVLNDKDTKFKNCSYRRSSPDDYKTNSKRSSHREKEKSMSKNSDRIECDRYKSQWSNEYDYYNKKSKKDNSFYRSHEKDSFDKYQERETNYNKERYPFRIKHSSRDRGETRFDKKKLLEIARKNAIAMMKSGSLPAALTLGPQAQEKVIAAIKSGGKTIEELTDFCKSLSKKEELGELSSLSEKEESDSDTDRPFHHPFQIKERPTTITMNIKNSVPLPVKSSLERCTELRMQFPVSSGQQHRKDEEWRPVSPPPPPSKVKNALVVAVIPTTATIPTTTTVPIMASISGTVPASILTPTIPTSNIPLPPSPTSTSSGLDCNLVNTSTQLQANTIQTPTQHVTNVNMDIGAVVSQRLAAIRKLQENPNDVQALNQMYSVDKHMQTWASSKQAPFGQFGGSTGAQILSQSELSSGYQAWARKDQLTSAAPVSGGMGMHLLQKMGWRPGEGLGKEKTGSLEPLLLDVKLDKKGLVAAEEQQRGKVRKMKAVATVQNLQGKHPVSLLGEYASKKKLNAPQYILEFECGPDHKKNFLFKVILNGVEYKPNIASNNKKEAKAAAATLCLQKIGLLPTSNQLPPHQTGV